MIDRFYAYPEVHWQREDFADKSCCLMLLDSNFGFRGKFDFPIFVRTYNEQPVPVFSPSGKYMAFYDGDYFSLYKIVR